MHDTGHAERADSGHGGEDGYHGRRVCDGGMVGCFINILLCCGIGNRLIQGDWHIALAYVGINILIVIGLWHHQKPILQIMRRSVHGKPQAK